MTTIYFHCDACRTLAQQDVALSFDRATLVNAGLTMPDLTGEAKVLHDIDRHLDLIEAS